MAIEYKKLYKHAFPAIQSKKEEFHLYGYDTVTEKEIWSFCLRKNWRKRKVDQLRIHEIVRDILRISPAEYMTFAHIEEQKETDWFSDLNQEELQLLLAPKKEK